MVDTAQKVRLEKLRRELGNAHSDLNKLEAENKTLKSENEKVIKELTKAEDLLTKTDELINGKKDDDKAELDGLLDGVEAEMLKVQDKVKDLTNLNKELIAQNQKLKEKSSSVYVKSLAIIGVFAGGAWVVVGIKEFVAGIKARTD